MSKALIIVDVQRDFCEGGSLAVSGGAAVATKISEWVAAHGQEYGQIIATKDWHQDPGAHFSDDPDFKTSWPAHCVAESEGSRFHANLANVPLDHIIYKGLYGPAYSGFEGHLLSPDNDRVSPSLSDVLHAYEITAVDICGLATDYCVKATALDARRLGYQTRVLWDKTAYVHIRTALDAVQEMQDAGVTFAGPIYPLTGLPV